MGGSSGVMVVERGLSSRTAGDPAVVTPLRWSIYDRRADAIDVAFPATIARMYQPAKTGNPRTVEGIPPRWPSGQGALYRRLSVALSV